jgi:hypothetical protein
MNLPYFHSEIAGTAAITCTLSLINALFDRCLLVAIGNLGIFCKWNIFHNKLIKQIQSRKKI